MNIAIIIGIAQYGSPLIDLPACRRDASAVATLVRATGKFDTVLELVEDTTSTALKARISNFVATTKDKDVGEVLFYFTGHGDFRNDEFYFLCSDYDDKRIRQTSIENTELDNWLRSFSPRLAIKVIDACHAGITYVKSEGKLKAYLQAATGSFKKCYFLFSSPSDGVSYQDQELSWFTRAFIKATVEHKGDSIRYKDVADFVADQFQQISEQKPLFVIQADLTEDFCSLSAELRAQVLPFLEGANASSTPALASAAIPQHPTPQPEI